MAGTTLYCSILTVQCYLRIHYMRGSNWMHDRNKKLPEGKWIISLYWHIAKRARQFKSVILNLSWIHDLRCHGIFLIKRFGGSSMVATSRRQTRIATAEWSSRWSSDERGRFFGGWSWSFGRVIWGERWAAAVVQLISHGREAGRCVGGDCWKYVFIETRFQFEVKYK